MSCGLRSRLWTGFTFVGYFTPIQTLAAEMLSTSLGPWETFWILFYAFATWGNAGFMREQVCKYMCPYARFQSVMFDSDTLTVTYDGSIGEPRGPRSKKARLQGSRPRHLRRLRRLCAGLPHRASTSAMACNTNASAAPPASTAATRSWTRWATRAGLIRYTTENVVKGKYPDSGILKHILRPRTIIYTVLLTAITGAFLSTASPPACRFVSTWCATVRRCRRKPTRA